MKIQFHLYNPRKYDSKAPILEELGESIKNITDLEVVKEIVNPGFYEIADIEPIYMEMQCEYKHLKFEVILHQLTYNSNLTVKVDIDFLTDYSFEETYEFKIMLKKLLKKYFKGLFIGLDEFNEDKCKDLYRSIHQVENQFRYFINNVLVSKVGADWFNICVSEDMKYKVTGFSEWYKKNYNEFCDVQSELFNMQTDDLISILQNSNLIGLSDKDYNLIKDAEKIIKNKNIYDASSIEKPQSLYDLYFTRYIDEEFLDAWFLFKNIRNTVAHNKPICTDFIRASNETINKLNDKLKMMNKTLINVNLSDEEKVIRDRYADELESLYFEEAGLSKTPTYEEIVEKIEDSTQGNELYGLIVDDFESAVGLCEEVIETIKMVSDEVSIDSTDEILFVACSILAEFIDQANRSNLHDLLNTMSSNRDAQFVFLKHLKVEAQKIIDSYLNRSQVKSHKIDLGTILDYRDIFNNHIAMELYGDIYPDKGSQDLLELKLEIDSIFTHGNIEINYGDFEMHDDGYSMPSWSDDFIVEISEVNSEFSNYVTRLTEKCTSIINKASDF